MKILIACEESQTVCREMRRLGHECYSCDIQEPSGGHPEWHILGDALKAIEGGQVTTMDGETHEVGKWDLLIAHPPCTYLSNVATSHYSLKCTPPEKVIERWGERAKAAVFFMRFVGADIPKIAVENPVGFMNSAYRKADQIINPYYFAADENDHENYHRKKTCLWLKGLPLLKYGKLLPPPPEEYITSSGKKIHWCDAVTTDRAKVRSKTFPGIAKAMAEQWAGDISSTSNVQPAGDAENENMNKCSGEKNDAQRAK